MPLSAGDRLGPYKVSGELGAGGMGIVLRARDTKLDRDVALKVLPEAFTSDPDRLARFEREARVLASLNHPNIGAIHGFEESGETKALVLELVEGPTLADRIARGPMAIDDVLPIAKQIAEALEAAHEQGIIHRDLKPANIKVKADGTVKVLDFGLAKAFQPEASGASASLSPTISLTAAATQMGMVIGTAAYMAPEQAKGQAIDKRADIWAYGAVVFEMLTGRKLFEASDASEMLASVLVKDPDISSLGGHIPAHIRSVVRQCLVKDPKERLRDIGDVRLAMSGVFEAPGAGPPVSTAIPPPRFWQRPAAIALIALGAAAAAFAVSILPGEDVGSPDVMRFAIVPPENATLDLAGRGHDLAISPDGTRIVYQSLSPGGVLAFHLRPIDQLSGAPIRGTEGAATPFISPNGEWVGFMPSRGSRALLKVSIFGGPAVTLTEMPNAIVGASWGTDERIIFGSSGDALYRVAAGGGEAEPLTTPDAEQGELSHFWPAIIPGANAVLFLIAHGNALTDGQVAVLDLDTLEIKRLGVSGVNPHYVYTRHLVYAIDDGSVRAVPFDATALEVTGSPVPLVEGVAVKSSGAANLDISDNGRLVYTSGEVGSPQRGLVWVDRGGNEEPTSAPERPYDNVGLSPDGARAATGLTDDSGNTDIWVSELSRGTLTRVTTEQGVEDNPLWTPDGRRLVFMSDRNGQPELFWQAADGSGTAERLLTMDDAVITIYPYDWSPDGSTLFITAVFPETGTDIGMVSVDGSGTWEPLLATAAVELAPAISPDGRWLAYSSNESGQMEVYVQRFPEMVDRRQISVGGGRRAQWSADGRELVYERAPSGGPPEALVRVPLDVDGSDPPSLIVGAAEHLFEWQYFARSGFRYADMSPDGQRLLMITTGDQTSADAPRPQIDVVLNWSEELKARVPTGQ